MYPQMPKIENILTDGVLESMPNRGLYETFLGLLMLIFVLYVKSAKSLQQSKVFIQYSLIVFGCLVFLFYSSSLIELVLAWVALNVSLYGLMLQGSRYSIEAATKYFLLGAASTGLLFFGVFLHFVEYGSVGYSTFSFLISSGISALPVLSLTQLVAFICVLTAFLFKLGVYPFHFYLTAVYGGVRYDMLGIITLPVKCITYFAMLNFVQSYGYAAVTFHSGFVFLGLGSLFMGAYGAYLQQKLRSFWAYSYVGSMGFVFLGFNVSSATLVTYVGTQYFMIYLFTWALVYWWFNAARLAESITTADGLARIRYTEIRYIAELSSTTNIAPKYRLPAFVLIFSLAGVPPTLGFWAKFCVLSSLTNTGFGYLVLLSVLLLLPLSAYNYLRLVRAMSFQMDELYEGSSVSAVFYFNNYYSFDPFIRLCIWLVLAFVPLSYYLRISFIEDFGFGLTE